MRSLALASLLFFAVAACGTESPTSTNSNPPPGNNQPPAPQVVAVHAQDFSFSPASVSVKAGATVEWTNVGGAAHTVTASNGTFSSGQIGGQSGSEYGGNYTPGGKYQRVFSTTGTFNYYCSNHSGMTGTVTVTP